MIARDNPCTFIGCGGHVPAEATQEVLGHPLCAMHAELYRNFLEWRRPQPTTNEIDKAVEVIARHILARASGDEGVVAWEDYPDIAETYWEKVVAAAERLAPYPDLDEYRAAYELLSADDA